MLECYYNMVSIVDGKEAEVFQERVIKKFKKEGITFATAGHQSYTVTRH